MRRDIFLAIRVTGLCRDLQGGTRAADLESRSEGWNLSLPLRSDELMDDLIYMQGKKGREGIDLKREHLLTSIFTE
jgi:hypothetical protein